MKVLTTSEMREADRLTTERFGVPGIALMENAGTAVAEFIQSRFAPLGRRRIVVFCGKGNNGGDGFVVARKLREMGSQPDVFLFADPTDLRGDAAANFKRLESASVQPAVISNAGAWAAAKDRCCSARIFVDALLGTGLRGPVAGLLAEVIQEINRHKSHATVIAVDIPSGLSGDSGEVAGPAVAADCTISFTAPKTGMLLAPASLCVGRLVVRRIGSPPELVDEVGKGKLRWLEPWEFRALPLERPPQANKGNYGHALIVAGSVGKAGAAALASLAALRMGAGLVTVATPEPVLATVAGFAPEVMAEPLPATPEGTISRRALDSGRFSEILKGKDVIAMGPGISTHEETRQFVRSVVTNQPSVPAVLDADGLNAFAGHSAELRGLKQMFVLTPHPGEMARLLGVTVKDVQEQRIAVAQKTAAACDAFVILKGYQTVVAAPDSRAWINSTGNPGMATGGTGDVLTGMLAGITAEFGATAWPTSLAMAVYLHGLAGDLAAAEVSEAPLIASDLLRRIPAAWARLRSEIDRV